MPTTSASLYEHLFALSTVMKQRVVDNFSGDSLNERWDVAGVFGGGGSGAMADAVDGGATLTTAGGATDGVELSFNNIRQFAYNGSVIIGVIKRGTTTTYTDFGFAGADGGLNTESADIRNSTSNTYYVLLTGDASSSSSTNTTTSIDTSWHSHKIELNGSNAQQTLDGTLDVTKATNLPTVKLEPAYSVWSISVASAKTGSIRYYEAYNT